MPSTLQQLTHSSKCTHKNSNKVSQAIHYAIDRCWRSLYVQVRTCCLSNGMFYIDYFIIEIAVLRDVLTKEGLQDPTPHTISSEVF